MNTVQEIINEVAAEIISVSKIAVTAERVFTEQKSCYLTREEIPHPYHALMMNRIDNTISHEDFIKKYSFDLSTTNTQEEIFNIYIPGRWGQLNNGAKGIVNYSDERDYNQTFSVMSDDTIQKINEGFVNSTISTSFLDRESHTEYLPVILQEPSYLAFKKSEGLHSANFSKIDQGILDRQSYYEIKNQAYNDTHYDTKEEFVFSFPLLAYKTKIKINDNSKDIRFEFIKIVVYRDSSLTFGREGLSDTYIIRTYKTTKAKTTVNSLTYITDFHACIERAKEIYNGYAMSSKWMELYDIENINEYIRERVKPSDESYRFVPDGYFGEKSYIHDRETNKYLTVPEYKIKFRKDLAKKAKNAVKNGDKILEEKMKEISKNPEKYQEMKSFLMSL